MSNRRAVGCRLSQLLACSLRESSESFIRYLHRGDEMPRPLEGVRVLDLGTYAIGPAAASYLGQLGADVVRIENPAGEAFMDFEPTMKGMASSYINANMAKRSIMLDLKSEGGLKTASALAARADVIVENRLPGVVDRLGLGYDDVARTNPQVVYVSMPGFSPGGPFEGKPALDMEIQALSGFASLEGAEGGPPELFRVYAHMDHTTALFLVQAALLGLVRRRRTGRGKHMKVGFFGSAVFLQITRLAQHFGSGRRPQRRGSASSTIAPSQSFPCLDGKYVNISAPDDETWRRLCQAIDASPLVADKRFSTNEARLENRGELAEAISRKTRGAPAWWWLKHLRRVHVPCAPVYQFDDLRRDEHFRSQRMVVEVETPWGLVVRGGHPWHFGETPCDEIRGTHQPGSDEQQILSQDYLWSHSRT